MPTITTKDGTQIYYEDSGAGRPVVFSPGWPLSSDSWEAQMFFLASNGCRCIAHDRRGHGRSRRVCRDDRPIPRYRSPCPLTRSTANMPQCKHASMVVSSTEDTAVGKAVRRRPT
jgi:pimeloyl-ACP methyl ester carboxylesterase